MRFTCRALALCASFDDAGLINIYLNIELQHLHDIQRGRLRFTHSLRLAIAAESFPFSSVHPSISLAVAGAPLERRGNPNNSRNEFAFEQIKCHSVGFHLSINRAELEPAERHSVNPCHVKIICSFEANSQAIRIGWRPGGEIGESRAFRTVNTRRTVIV